MVVNIPSDILSRRNSRIFDDGMGGCGQTAVFGLLLHHDLEDHRSPVLGGPKTQSNASVQAYTSAATGHDLYTWDI